MAKTRGSAERPGKKRPCTERTRRAARPLPGASPLLSNTRRKKMAAVTTTEAMLRTQRVTVGTADVILVLLGPHPKLEAASNNFACTGLAPARATRPCEHGFFAVCAAAVRDRGLRRGYFLPIRARNFPRPPERP